MGDLLDGAHEGGEAVLVAALERGLALCVQVPRHTCPHHSGFRLQGGGWGLVCLEAGLSVQGVGLPRGGPIRPEAGCVLRLHNEALHSV